MRILRIVGIVVLASAASMCLYLAVTCAQHNVEHEELTDAARQNASGSFVHLSDGVTHYELAGPENGLTVVLIHGFSVPYYLWDQTFDPLVKAVFRVDVRTDFRRVGASHKPVMLVWGQLDKDVPFEVSKEVLVEIPQAEFHPLANAAHVGFYESPEVVNPMLIEFLSRR